MPVIEALRDACVSVDTYRAPVAEAALAAGASFVNDYTGGHDPALAGVVAAAGAGLVVTHYRGRPRANPSRSYEGTVDDVLRFLEARGGAGRRGGVGERSVLVDPGFGFGKATRLDLRSCATSTACARSASRCWPPFAQGVHGGRERAARGRAARHGDGGRAGGAAPGSRCCGCTTSRSSCRCCGWPTRSATADGA